VNNEDALGRINHLSIVGNIKNCPCFQQRMNLENGEDRIQIYSVRKTRLFQLHLQRLSRGKASQNHSFFYFWTRKSLVGFNSMTLQICSRYKTPFPFISVCCCYSKTWQQYFIACINPAHVLRKCYIMESLGAHM